MLILLEYSMSLKTVCEIYDEIPSRKALNFAAIFGAWPIQTRSLLFLMPLRTAITLLVSTPTLCESDNVLVA